MPRARTLNLDHFRVKYPSRRYGLIVLQSISVEDMDFLLSLSKELPNREYLVQAIHHQLASPSWDLDTVRKLPNRTLSALGRTWLTDDYGLKRKLPPYTNFFAFFKENLRTLIIEYQSDMLHQFSSSLVPLVNSLPSRPWEPLSSQSSLKVLQGIINQAIETSSVVESAHAAMSQFIKAYDSQVASVQSLVWDVVKAYELTWQNQISSVMAEIMKSSVFTVSTDVISANLQSVAKSLVQSMAVVNSTSELDLQVRAIITESRSWSENLMFQLVDIAQLTTTPYVFENQLGPVLKAAIEVSGTYGRVFNEAIDSAVLDSILPPGFAQLSISSQMTSGFVGTSALLSRSPGDPVDSRALEIVEHVDSAQVAAQDEIEVRLSRIHPRFVNLYKGTWYTLKSNSPDRLRQCTHSARELLNQLLDMGAPDSVFTLEDLQQRGHKNQATRKMRAAYILGTKARSNRVALIDNTAEALDEIYGILSSVAHDRSEEVERIEFQIRGYLTTWRGLLMVLISAWQEGNDV